MHQPLAAPDFPPVARLRSFHPFLLALSWILIVVAVAVGMALGIFWAHAPRSALLIVFLPAGMYWAARIFLPIELRADQDTIRWKEPFHSAQVVRRRDVAGIKQRVTRNSSYAYFVDRDGNQQLFVGPIFSPMQMRDFALSVGLPIEDVTVEPPRSPGLEVAEERSATEGNRSYGIVFMGFLALLAWVLQGLVTYAVVAAVLSLDAYNHAPQCTVRPPQPQACRYVTTLTATSVTTDSRGLKVWLAAPAGTFSSGVRSTWVRVSPNDPKPAIEAGSSVQAEIWDGKLVTMLNGARTDSYNTLRANANWLLPLVFLPASLGTTGFLVWAIRGHSLLG